jgi:hypothetical protein
VAAHNTDWVSSFRQRRAPRLSIVATLQIRKTCRHRFLHRLGTRTIHRFAPQRVFDAYAGRENCKDE